MINAQNLAVLLRALRQGEASPHSLPGPATISRALPIVPVSTEDGSSPMLRGAIDRPVPGAPTMPPPPGQADSGGARGAHERAPSRPSFAPETDRPTSSRAPATRAPLLPGSPGSARLTLSPAGELLREVVKAGEPPAPPVIHAREPLMATPPRSPEILARALAHTVARSGLFYESHLARWAADGYPAAALAEEPQAALPPAREMLAPATTLAGAAPGATDTLQALASKEASVTLVRQQLEALEARQFVVQTELWPGQRARIAFEEEPAARQGGNREPSVASTWRTHVEVLLPSLGLVRATIGLEGTRVHCVLTAGSVETSTRLAEARTALRAGLDRAGLGLATCEVQHAGAR